MDAIVLGLGVNGLAVVRSLGEKDLAVSGIFHEATDELGIHSKYLINSSKLPRQYNTELLLETCLSLCKDKSCGKVTIFCSTDSFAAKISENQTLFEQHFFITTPDKNMYWHFVAKQPTADICIANNFPIPKTIYSKVKGVLFDKASKLDFPLIIKPNLTFGDDFPGKNLIVKTPDELANFIETYPQLETEVIAQEIVPSGDGKIYLVTCYSDSNGKVRIAYSGKKIRQYLPDFGVTCFGVSEQNDYLKSITIRFLEAINYTGYATLEFAYDKASDKYYFIELNIRSFYHNQLFKDAGLDINYLAYQVVKKQGDCPEHCLTQQVDNIYWLDFTRDFGSFMRKPALSLFQWIKSITKARSFAYFNCKDLKPFIVSLKTFMIITIRSVMNKKR